MKSWGWAALPLVIIAAGLFSIPALEPGWRSYTFLGVLLLLAAELAVVGQLINRRPAGAFIDNRNRISLSKLQMGAWTVVVLAAFVTAAAFNAAEANGAIVDALKVAIPGELLLAMGISSTSLVAAPALLSLKADETPHAEAQQAAANRLNTGVVATGKIAGKTTPAKASWADLVTGDELGNVGTPDLGKIQQALITLLLLGCYVGYVFMLFGKSGSVLELPKLDKSFVWLLGISHASYLAYKAAPHTTTGPAPSGAGSQPSGAVIQPSTTGTQP